MSNRSKLIGITLSIAAIGVLVYLAWGKSTPPSAAGKGFPPAVIASTEVKQENWQPSLLSVGSVVATNGISVSSEVNGIVSAIAFNSGQPVEKGQELIKLDAAVDLAALEALRAEQRLAEIKFNRAKELLQKNVNTKSDYEQAEATFDAARARVKQQEEIIKRKVIRAPFAGLAGIRQVDLGQYFQAGSPIVSLQALDPIYVDYTLPERFISRVKTGQVVNVKFDALPSQVFKGEISAINAGIDTGTRTLKIRATLKNPDKLLRPGMFAEIETITDDAQAVLTLPRTAISFNTYGKYVFLINKDDTGATTVKRMAVETGDTRSGRVEVKNLKEGQEVVRAGLVKLRDSMPVKIDNQIELNDSEIQSP